MKSFRKKYNFFRFRKNVKISDISYAKKYDRKKSNNYLPRKRAKNTTRKQNVFNPPKFSTRKYTRKYTGKFLENSRPENTPENSQKILGEKTIIPDENFDR